MMRRGMIHDQRRERVLRQIVVLEIVRCSMGISNVPHNSVPREDFLHIIKAPAIQGQFIFPEQFQMGPARICQQESAREQTQKNQQEDSRFGSVSRASRHGSPLRIDFAWS
jgi:hypothetical protein